MKNLSASIVCLGLLAGCVALVGGCEKNKATTTATKPLWDRLGGEPAVTAVVDKFVGRTAGNPKVNFFRKGVAGYPEWKPSDAQVATLKRRLVEFISVASGGPLKYSGKDMKSAHAGMKISTAEFNAIAADLSATLDEFKVPAKEKGELMAAVAGTAKDMVEIK
ncbi:MAG: group I truncated hemoglobin [Phycisphaerales bacterium]